MEDDLGLDIKTQKQDTKKLWFQEGDMFNVTLKSGELSTENLFQGSMEVFAECA
jgi:hypothetical protein